MITRKNLTLYRGDDTQFTVALKQKKGEYLSALDLSQLVRADLQASAEGQTVLSLSTEQGTIKVLSAEEGLLKLSIPHALTAKANWRNAKYDLQLIDSQGWVQTVLLGDILLTHDITRTETV